MAGVATVAAGLVLIASGAFLAVFFSTWKEPWGRANDATIALFAVLMIPAVFGVYDLYGYRSRWLVGIVAAVALAGVLTIAVSSGLTAAGRLDWRRSAKIGAFGFVGFVVCIVGVAAFALAWNGLPRAFAWFGIATAVLTAAAVSTAVRFTTGGGVEAIERGERPPAAAMAVLVAAFVCYPAWCIWLGLSLG